MNEPRFEIALVNEAVVVLRDLGPWDQHPTITNAAERVVQIVSPMLAGRRLEYFDSEGERTQLVVRDGKFSHFAPAKEVAS